MHFWSNIVFTFSTHCFQLFWDPRLIYLEYGADGSVDLPKVVLLPGPIQLVLEPVLCLTSNIRYVLIYLVLSN